ncbi:DALR anticodon-binding domain-containing protein [Cohnella faecalis]|uniref:DALR anticodon-binding domain-containing protein n=1 Tax=Cohnella faecalis TaxID=2315694 RepID=UPI001F1B30A6|nr:DALR anticodon-binding domain-containing protein [Cohnella faecalis]
MRKSFFTLRVKNVLTERNVRYDVADAILGAGSDDVRRTILRAATLNEAASEERRDEFRPIVEAFNRACNLGAKADSRQVDANLFADAAEGSLYEAWQTAHGTFVKAIAEADTDAAFAALAALKEPVTTFFETVMVMAEDEAVRRNRLALLALIADDVKAFADFTKLVG